MIKLTEYRIGFVNGKRALILETDTFAGTEISIDRIAEMTLSVRLVKIKGDALQQKDAVKEFIKKSQKNGTMTYIIDTDGFTSPLVHHSIIYNLFIIPNKTYNEKIIKNFDKMNTRFIFNDVEQGVMFAIKYSIRKEKIYVDNLETPEPEMLYHEVNYYGGD